MGSPIGSTKVAQRDTSLFVAIQPVPLKLGLHKNKKDIHFVVTILNRVRQAILLEIDGRKGKLSKMSK